MINRIFGSLIFFLVTTCVLAQSDFDKKFQNGKEFLKQGKYSIAMEQLLPLTVDDPQNPYTEIAHYLYASAAYKSGNLSEARQLLLQLTQKYPNWEKLDEAYYLLGNVSLEQKNYRQAIPYLWKINPDQKKDSDVMKEYYFKKIISLDTLKQLQKEYPADPVLGKVLAQRLSKTATSDKDKMLLQYLVQEFKLNPADFQNTTNARSVMKKSYNVAVLMPFMLKEVNSQQWSRGYSYLAEMYQAMKIAVDTLKRAGVDVKIYPYDTERDNKKLVEILKYPEMKDMDLIIGPIYPNNYQIVADFTRDNKIININPLSNNGKLLENNESIYLFQPTLEAQAGAAANYASKNFTKGKDNKRVNVVIFYGEDGKDSLMAQKYRDSITSKGLKVSKFVKVDRKKLTAIEDALKDSTKAPIHHIFISCTEQVIIANFISTLDIARTGIPVLTRSEWLQLNLLTYEQFERRNVHFIHPDYIDYGDSTVSAFKIAFTEKNNIFPGPYAFEAYDLLILFGTALGKYGTQFQSGLASEGFVEGKTMQGFDFSFLNTNQFVPITTFRNQELIILNKPEVPGSKFNENRK